MCYNPASDASGRVNKLVAGADGPFCHCELHFSDGSAFTIYMEGVAVLRPRRFSSPNYTAVPVPCTREQEARCRAFAAAVVEGGVPFSTLRMVNAFCRLPSPGVGADVEPGAHVGHGSFCSELVAEALQAGEVLPASVAARHVTPSGLARMLREGGASVEGGAQRQAGRGEGGATQAIGFRGSGV